MSNFNSLRRLEVAFFGRFLSTFCGRHYWPLFRKLACELAEVTSEAHLKPGAFTWLLTAGNLTVLGERFHANCLLHDFEIFLAAAVMTDITCVVQCYNNKSDHRAGISLHQSPASEPAVEKRRLFVLTQCEFQPKRHLRRLITSRRSFPRGLFMSQDPRGRSFHCPFQLYGKKKPKKHYLREQDERYLIL